MLTKYKGKLIAIAAPIALPALAMAESTPAGDIQAGAATAQGVFTAFAAVAVGAFIFRMVMKFARKGS